jgi:hypothetical protein
VSLSRPESPKVRLGLGATVALLLGLYALFFALIGCGVYIFGGAGWDASHTLAGLGLLTLFQAAFVFVAGTRDLIRPVRRPRLVVPMLVFAAATLLLVFGFYIATAELLDPYVDAVPDTTAGQFLIVVLGLQWLVWVGIVWVYAVRWPRVIFFARVVQMLLAGSLFELLVSIPAHLVVSRRPGCFVGLGTMLGIIAGIVVLAFTCGPAAVWLMLRGSLTPREQVELRRLRRLARVGGPATDGV